MKDSLNATGAEVLTVTPEEIEKLQDQLKQSRMSPEGGEQNGFIRLKLIRLELPDDLKPQDKPLEAECAVNVKERIEVEGRFLNLA